MDIEVVGVSAKRTKKKTRRKTALEYYTQLSRLAIHAYTAFFCCVIYILFITSSRLSDEQAKWARSAQDFLFGALLQIFWHVVVIVATIDIALARSQGTSRGIALAATILWLVCTLQLLTLQYSTYNRYKLASDRCDTFRDYRNMAIVRNLADDPLDMIISSVKFNDFQKLGKSEMELLEAKMHANVEDLFQISFCILFLLVCSSFLFYFNYKIYSIINNSYTSLIHNKL